MTCPFTNTGSHSCTPPGREKGLQSCGIMEYSQRISDQFLGTAGGTMKQPAVLSSSLRPAGPRKRSVDSSVGLSLSSQYSASGYHAPGAMRIRTGAIVPKTDKGLALAGLSPLWAWKGLPGMLNSVDKKHCHGSGLGSSTYESASERHRAPEICQYGDLPLYSSPEG